MSDTASFLSESPADTAEFEAAREQSVETPEVPAPSTPEPAKPEGEPAKADPAKAEPAKAEPAKPADDRPKFVPHAALHEERMRRQAVEKELAELRAGRQPEPEKPTEIDPETDPIAALKEIREYQQKQRQETEQQNQLRAFDDRARSHEKDFADVTPDYADAVGFLREARAKQIMDGHAAVGRPITQEQLGAILLHEARSTAHDALTNGKNPGEVFYALSKSFGYTGKKAADPAPSPTPTPEPVAAALPVPSKADETIDRITRGQKAASKVGGGEAPDDGEMSLERLSKLEGAAFDAGFAKFSKSQRTAH
jgi:hypothetical protein